jgi:hypothetical protein
MTFSFSDFLETVRPVTSTIKDAVTYIIPSPTKVIGDTFGLASQGITASAAMSPYLIVGAGIVALIFLNKS